ncbi:hypothetical protein [Phytohabitans aurantiacus]|uniref:Mce-associated membrane protein n=1 Tax=Phytohabitans aurantiacus TaxID=3016789 RepID=A0ABQ5R4W9_9ACTN|nr:hypothetical protein [Phytohabitans aurantiacus]GLI00912.1 hypothetical protein Pa4123_61880 [Phytohabitans aurantiacus]
MRAMPRVAAMVALCVAVLAAAGLVLGGRGADSSVPPERTLAASVSPPTDPATDYREPTAVCLAFAGAVYRRDTRIDTGAQDAYRRAMAYATGELAAAVAAQPPGRAPNWATWRAHQATTVPTATAAVADGQPADTTYESYRAVRVSVAPVGVDGWRGPIEQRLVLCTLRRDGGDWRVEGYQISEPV